MSGEAASRSVAAPRPARKSPGYVVAPDESGFKDRSSGGLFLMLLVVLLPVSLPARASLPSLQPPQEPPPSLARPATLPDLLPLPRPDLSEMEPGLVRQIEGVSEVVEELLRSGGDRNQLLAAYGALGHLYAYYEVSDAARVCYENGRRLAPEDFRWPYYLGWLQGDLGEDEEALQLFLEAHRLAPRDVPTLVRLGNLELDLDDPDQAVGYFRQALDIEPDLAAGWWGLGRVAALRGEHREAIRAFEKTLELEPEAGVVHYALAQSLRAVGDLEAARESLGRYNRGKVRFPDPLVDRIGETSALSSLDLVRSLAARRDAFPDLKFLSYTLAFLADMQGATDHLAKELATWPAERREADRLQRARLYYALGGLLVHQGEQAEAMQHFRTALELAPDLDDARIKLANGLAREGRFSEAVEALSAVLEREPNNTAALLKRAASWMGLERWGEAAKDLRRLERSDPSSHEVEYRLAVCLERLGRPEEALPRYQAAGRLDPEPERAARARLQAADLLLRRGSEGEAAEELDRALELVPGLLEARLTRAGLAIRAGDFDAALGHFDQALTFHPDSTPAHIGRATVLLLLGRYRAAAEALQASLDVLPNDGALLLLTARVLAAAPDASVHDGARALELARRLEVAQPGPRSAEALALAEAESGRFDDAVRWQQEAVERARRSGRERLARDLESRLPGLEAGRPWRAASPGELIVLPNEG